MKDAYIPSIPTVNIKEFYSDIEKLYYHFIKTGESLVVTGYSKPGIGKSESAIQLTKKIDLTGLVPDGKKGIGFKNVRLGQVFVTDIQGNPINTELSDGEIKQTYSTPSYLPSVSIDGEYGILLLDELNQASQVVGGMIQQLLDSRMIGSYVLPKGWMIITCMNLKSHSCHVNELSTANNNRIIHYNIREDIEVWAEYAIKNNIEPLIISYLLKDNPQHLYVIPQDSTQKAFPSPRSWKFVDTLIKAGLHDRIECAIGDAVAANFKNYYQFRFQLPDWDKIADPKYKWEHDKKDISLPYAVTQTAIAKTTLENMQHLIDFIEIHLGTEYTQVYAQGIYEMHIKNRDFLVKLAQATLKDGKNYLNLAKEIGELKKGFQ